MVMDMQPAIFRNLKDASLLIKNVLIVIDLARIIKIPIVYITIDFRG